MRNDINILTKEEIAKKLESFDGWTYKDNKISKEFKFNDFMDALNFINQLAPFFEESDHHPDIHIFYSKVLFELQRFDIGGKVTNLDFIVAQKIEDLYKLKKIT